jgi:hypothetical protein
MKQVLRSELEICTVAVILEEMTMMKVVSLLVLQTHMYQMAVKLR